MPSGFPFRPASVLALSVWLMPTALAELHPRLDGAAAYDDALNITWLTDAGLSGNRSWDQQLEWIAGLNSVNHLGFDDWRLASMSVAAGLPTGAAAEVVDCSTIWQPLCRDNELGYMYVHNLGGRPGVEVTGSRTVGDVTIANIQPRYWSGTESGITNAWMYHFDIGFAVWSPKGGNRYGWAVRDGDIPALDSDADGIADSLDNCVLEANPGQRDSNGDGYGNRCDPDLNDDLIVNVLDLSLLKLVLFSTDADADFNSDGAVNIADLAIMKDFFFGQPGPSALVR